MMNKMTVWYNAKISNPERPHRTYEAMVTDADGSIQWLGSTEDALLYFPDLTDRYDLKGHRVLPGFIDSHLDLELIGKEMKDRDGSSPQDDSDLTDIILASQEELLGYGITGVSDAHTTLSLIQALENLDATNQLKLRFFGNLAVIEERGKNAVAWEKLLQRRKDNEFTGRIRLPGVKLALDGTVGEHTAAFKEPYADRPDTTGELLYTPEELVEHFRWAKAQDLQVMIHAIGDRATEVAVNAMADVLIDPEDTDRRWRIEHFQHTDTATMDLAGYLGVIPSLQPLQEVGDRELLPQRLGKQRANRAHRQRSFRYFVNHFVLNSDAPVDTPNPWEGIAAAVSRQDGEALTLREALSAYSREPALVLGANRELGTLDIGKQADFIVLDEDPFVKETDLASIKVLQTVIGGEIVYAA